MASTPDKSRVSHAKFHSQRGTHFQRSPEAGSVSKGNKKYQDSDSDSDESSTRPRQACEKKREQPWKRENSPKSVVSF